MFPLGRTTSRALASRTISAATVTNHLVRCPQSVTSTPIKKPCVLLGFPDPDNFRVPSELPEGISLWVEKNNMGRLGDGAWCEEVTSKKDEKVYLKAVSLGEKNDRDEGGSFGGWITDQDKVYGLTCKHCLPTAQNDSIVVSPSTLEVTSVFEINLNYSTLSPQRLHFHKSRDEVAYKLFNSYEHSYCEHGVEVDHDFGGSSIHRKSLLLSGSKVETVVEGMLSDAVFLQLHNQELRAQGKAEFVLPENLKPSSLDWLIFEAEPDRIGRNFFMQNDVAEHVRKIGYLAPNDHVFKFGRTSGLTRGKVSKYVLMEWLSGKVTHEIAVVGTHPRSSFARKGDPSPFGINGDSGAAVVISTHSEDLMGGLLIGADRKTRLAVVTPFNILLQSIGKTFSREFKLADLANICNMEEREN